MKNLLKKAGIVIVNNKIKILSGAITIGGFALNFASSVIEGKQLEETVNQAVKAEIASMIDSEDKEKVEEAQNE